MKKGECPGCGCITKLFEEFENWFYAGYCELCSFKESVLEEKMPND